MIEITGKYNTAKVLVSDWTKLEEACHKQILNLLNQKFSEGSNIAIMADCHAGAGCVIGFTQTIVDKAVPNLVGVDIGCGLLVLKIDKKYGKELFNKPGLEKLDKVIRQHIPMEMNHRNKKHAFCDKVHINEIKAPINAEKLMLSIGTMGGGNHFIEVDKDSNGDYYIVIHSGSRHLGIEVCKYYQNLAIKYHSSNTKERDELVAKLKAEGREKDIQAELAKIKKEPIPNELAYLEGNDLEDYLHDMKLAQEYAIWNREAMLDEIMEHMGIKKKMILDKFCTIHNYIDVENKILRKGAISLQKDETAVIPINMSYGSLIVKGKGNAEYNFSGPHGAGRLMSRSAAKESLKMEDFKASMKDVFTTSVSTATIDEAPMAYKPAEDILENIKDLCDVVEIIKPIYNVKAGDEE